MSQATVCILGGTGFVGRHLIQRLTRAGYNLRVLTRHRERHRALLVNPRLQLLETDNSDVQALQTHIAGCYAVINLVGILNETRHPNNSFAQAHVELPRRVLQAMQATGVTRLLHMSALNASPEAARSLYLRSKGQGENLVHAAAQTGMRVTSFRPSVIFGPGDSFFNRFASLLRLTPGLFPLACADSRFAPVSVGDLCQAMTQALAHRGSEGKAYDLCGPQSYSLAELVEYTATQIGVRRKLWKLSPRLSWWQARLLEWAPGKPFSRDNYWSLQQDSLCGHNDLASFGIQPTAIESIVPAYLSRRTVRGRYQQLRSRARRS